MISSGSINCPKNLNKVDYFHFPACLFSSFLHLFHSLAQGGGNSHVRYLPGAWSHCLCSMRAPLNRHLAVFPTSPPTSNQTRTVYFLCVFLQLHKIIVATPQDTLWVLCLTLGSPKVVVFLFILHYIYFINFVSNVPVTAIIS